MQRALERTRARRPWLIATSAALVLGIAVSPYLYVKALAAGRAARENAAIAEAANRAFSDDVLSAASPYAQSGDEAPTIRDAIAGPVARIDDAGAASRSTRPPCSTTSASCAVRRPRSPRPSPGTPRCGAVLAAHGPGGPAHATGRYVAAGLTGRLALAEAKALTASHRRAARRLRRAPARPPALAPGRLLRDSRGDSTGPGRPTARAWLRPSSPTMRAAGNDHSKARC